VCFKSSSFVATQAFSWSEENIMGDHLNTSNQLFCDQVKLDLHDSVGYGLSLSWVLQWNSKQQCMALLFGK
jgi:hypothetical protein